MHEKSTTTKRIMCSSFNVATTIENAHACVHTHHRTSSDIGCQQRQRSSVPAGDESEHMSDDCRENKGSEVKQRNPHTGHFWHAPSPHTHARTPYTHCSLIARANENATKRHAEESPRTRCTRNEVTCETHLHKAVHAHIINTTQAAQTHLTLTRAQSTVQVQWWPGRGARHQSTWAPAHAHITCTVIVRVHGPTNTINTNEHTRKHPLCAAHMNLHAVWWAASTERATRQAESTHEHRVQCASTRSHTRTTLNVDGKCACASPRVAHYTTSTHITSSENDTATHTTHSFTLVTANAPHRQHHLVTQRVRACIDVVMGGPRSSTLNECVHVWQADGEREQWTPINVIIRVCVDTVICGGEERQKREERETRRQDMEWGMWRNEKDNNVHAHTQPRRPTPPHTCHTTLCRHTHLLSAWIVPHSWRFKEVPSSVPHVTVVQCIPPGDDGWEVYVCRWRRSQSCVKKWERNDATNDNTFIMSIVRSLQSLEGHTFSHAIHKWATAHFVTTAHECNNIRTDNPSVKHQSRTPRCNTTLKRAHTQRTSSPTPRTWKLSIAMRVAMAVCCDRWCTEKTLRKRWKSAATERVVVGCDAQVWEWRMSRWSTEEERGVHAERKSTGKPTRTTTKSGLTWMDTWKTWEERMVMFTVSQKSNQTSQRECVEPHTDTPMKDGARATTHCPSWTKTQQTWTTHDPPTHTHHTHLQRASFDPVGGHARCSTVLAVVRRVWEGECVRSAVARSACAWKERSARQWWATRGQHTLNTTAHNQRSGVQCKRGATRKILNAQSEWTHATNDHSHIHSGQHCKNDDDDNRTQWPSLAHVRAQTWWYWVKQQREND